MAFSWSCLRLRFHLEFSWKRFLPILPVAFFGLAIWLLFHEISHYRWQEIEQSIGSIPLAKICFACGLVSLNYLVLVGYDWLALKAIGGPTGTRKGCIRLVCWLCR